MTIADWTLLAMLVLTIGAVAPAKFSGLKEYDNARPRDPAFYTEGFRQRALWAHQNCYESLPFFYAAVILAEMRGAPQVAVNALAVGVLVARVAYVAAYWADRSTVRSVVWAVALLLTLGIFIAPLWG